MDEIEPSFTLPNLLLQGVYLEDQNFDESNNNEILSNTSDINNENISLNSGNQIRNANNFNEESKEESDDVQDKEELTIFVNYNQEENKHFKKPVKLHRNF